MKITKCVRCGRDRRHKAKGLCKSCYVVTSNQKNGYKYKLGGLRNKHLEQQNNCKCCGVNNDLVVHHKDRNKKNNTLSNFETLCRSCHSRWHKYLRMKEFFTKHQFNIG